MSECPLVVLCSNISISRFRKRCKQETSVTILCFNYFKNLLFGSLEGKESNKMTKCMQAWGVVPGLGLVAMEALLQHNSVVGTHRPPLAPVIT